MGENALILRRRQLGLFVGQAGQAYVADPEARPMRVYVLTTDALAEALHGQRIAARRWAVAMPGRDCLYKTLTLPANDDDEVRRMLAFEVPDMVPLLADQMCYDAVCGPADADGYRCATVVIAPQSRVENAADVLRQAGLVPDVVVPTPLALLRWARHHGGLSYDHRALLLLCVDRHACQMVASAKGRLLAARELLLQPDAGLDVADCLADGLRLFDQTAPVSSGAVDVIVLAGRDEPAAAAARQMSTVRQAAGCGHARCEVLTSDIEILPQPGLAGRTDVSEISAASALGACMADANGDAAAFNMVPNEWHEQRRRRRRWIERGTTAGLAAAAAVLLAVLLSVRNGRLARQLETLTRQIEPIRTVATELETKKQQVRIIQSQLHGRGLPLEILSELYRRLPQDVHLSRLTMDLEPARSELRVAGSAGDLSAVFALPSILEQSLLFTDVRLDGAQQIRRGGQTRAAFGCRCGVSDRARTEPRS